MHTLTKTSWNTPASWVLSPSNILSYQFNCRERSNQDPKRLRRQQNLFSTLSLHLAPKAHFITLSARFSKNYSKHSVHFVDYHLIGFLLRPCSAAPMIAKNVEKNDKSDVRTMLGFFLGQCATQAPDKDPVLQRRQEADIFARVLNAVIPVCNRRRIKNGVKN